MNEETEKENKKEKRKITCPICEKRFRDMRGLTSHARHVHGMDKNKIMEALDATDDNAKEDSTAWKILGGLGAIVLSIITIGKFK